MKFKIPIKFYRAREILERELNIQFVECDSLYQGIYFVYNRDGEYYELIRTKHPQTKKPVREEYFAQVKVLLEVRTNQNWMEKKLKSLGAMRLDH
jgi:hypothetical protein